MPHFDIVKELNELPPHGRRRFLAQADPSVITTIRRGILFVMAFWSISSIRSFAELKKVLAKTDLEGRLEVVVVDIDGCPDFGDIPEFAGQLHGTGEVAWVLDGKILRTSGLGFHPDCFEPFTRLLLASALDHS